MSNAPMIDLSEKALEELYVLDPSLTEGFSSSSSNGEYQFDLSSELLSTQYPELFYGGFNSTIIDRINGKFMAAQHFMIGHAFSEFPGHVPGFVTVAGPVHGAHGIKRETKALGVVARDIHEAEKRGLLGVDDICRIAEDTFLTMFPDVRKGNGDYGAVQEEIWRKKDEFIEKVGVKPAPRSPEKEFLDSHVEKGLAYPVYSHLFSRGALGVALETMRTGKKPDTRGYTGSILLTVPQFGDISELDITGNFHKFYSAIRHVLKERGLSDPLDPSIVESYYPEED